MIPSRGVLAGVAGAGATCMMLALAPSLAVAGCALAILGAAAAVYNVAEYSLIQRETPSEFRGRVFALATVSSQALRPLSLLLAGVIAGLVDVRLALAVMALATLLAWVVGVMHKPLRSSR